MRDEQSRAFERSGKVVAETGSALTVAKEILYRLALAFGLSRKEVSRAYSTWRCPGMLLRVRVAVSA